MYIGPGGLGPLLPSSALLIDEYLQPPQVIVSIIDPIDPPCVGIKEMNGPTCENVSRANQC